VCQHACARSHTLVRVCVYAINFLPVVFPLPLLFFLVQLESQSSMRVTMCCRALCGSLLLYWLCNLSQNCNLSRGSCALSFAVCTAVYCSALQCAAVCCSVLQCVAVCILCCSVLKFVGGVMRPSLFQSDAVWCSLLQCVATISLHLRARAECVT